MRARSSLKIRGFLLALAAILASKGGLATDSADEGAEPKDLDEFSIFLDSAGPDNAKEKRGFSPSIEFSFEAETGFGRRVWREEYFSSLGAPTPKGAYPLSVSVEPGLRAEILPGLSFLARVGLECEGYVDEAANAQVKASIPEAAFAFGFAEGVFLRGGIIALPPGGNPSFRPAYWPSRFSEHIYAKGGTSFLGLQASIYLGDFKLALLFLPEIGFPALDLFRKPQSLVVEGQATGSAAEARVSASFLGGSAALFGFCQDHMGSFAPRFGGFGFDAAFPIGEFADIRGEGLYSSGLPSYEPRNGSLSLEKGSTDRWGFAASVSAGATVFSFLELRAGYSYSGRGLPASAWREPGIRVDERAAPVHQLSFFMSLPKLTDSLGLSLFALLSPEDLSSRYYLELFFDGGKTSSFHLRGELCPSPLGSVMGSSPIMASISLIADILIRENFRHEQ